MISYVLTILGIITLIAFLYKRDKKSSVTAIMLKSITSLFFVASGISSLLINYLRNGISADSEIISMCLLIFGLVCGMVGDILLDFKIYFKALNLRYLCFDKERDILMTGGMLAFGLGHIMYISSYLIRYTDNWIYLIYSLLIGIAIISMVMFMSKRIMHMDFRGFLVPSYIYGALLSSFVVYSVFALTMDKCEANIILLIGSLLFIISDVILSVTYFSKKEDYEKKGMFNPESKFMIITNHIAYYLAQFLIAISILYI